MLFLSRQMLPRPTLTISTLLQIRTYNSPMLNKYVSCKAMTSTRRQQRIVCRPFFHWAFGHAVFVFVGWRSHKFWGNLCSGYTTHSVMVVITVNPKIFGGIGRTEEVLPRVEIFTVPLQSPTTRSSVSSSKMVGRQKRSSVACTGCRRRLDKSKTSLQCNRCVSPNVTGVIRFHVE